MLVYQWSHCLFHEPTSVQVKFRPSQVYSCAKVVVRGKLTTLKTYEGYRDELSIMMAYVISIQTTGRSNIVDLICSLQVQRRQGICRRPSLWTVQRTLSGKITASICNVTCCNALRGFFLQWLKFPDNALRGLSPPMIRVPETWSELR